MNSMALFILQQCAAILVISCPAWSIVQCAKGKKDAVKPPASARPVSSALPAIAESAQKPLNETFEKKEEAKKFAEKDKGAEAEKKEEKTKQSEFKNEKHGEKSKPEEKTPAEDKKDDPKEPSKEEDKPKGKSLADGEDNKKANKKSGEDKKLSKKDGQDEIQPKKNKLTAKEQKIAESKEKRGKGDYPTMDDVLSDWDSEKEKQKKGKEAAVGGKSKKEDKKSNDGLKVDKVTNLEDNSEGGKDEKK